MKQEQQSASKTSQDNRERELLSLMLRIIDDHLGALTEIGLNVYMCCLRHANDANLAQLSLTTLARYTGLRTRTVQRKLEMLIERSFLELECDGGPTTTRTYRVLSLPAVQKPAGRRKRGGGKLRVVKFRSCASARGSYSRRPTCSAGSTRTNQRQNQPRKGEHGFNRE
ncbi:MAG: hypothetical protein H7Z14_15285 [Anaerolineae bacterium]|nr:hypothetical protein [Phycisphaerae bacterium]